MTTILNHLDDYARERVRRVRAWALRHRHLARVRTRGAPWRRHEPDRIDHAVGRSNGALRRTTP